MSSYQQSWTWAFLMKSFLFRTATRFLMAQKLAANLGLAVGVSSGCNFLAAVKLQQQLGSDAIVVTV